jgi:hypothetical protein
MITPVPTTQLTDQEQAILDFEQQWWKYPGAKATAISERFDMTSTRYYQVLNHLLDQPAAMAYAPMLVRRLLRLRDQRVVQRSARARGVQ